VTPYTSLLHSTLQYRRASRKLPTTPTMYETAQHCLDGPKPAKARRQAMVLFRLEKLFCAPLYAHLRLRWGTLWTSRSPASVSEKKKRCHHKTAVSSSSKANRALCCRREQRRQGTCVHHHDWRRPSHFTVQACTAPLPACRCVHTVEVRKYRLFCPCQKRYYQMCPCLVHSDIKSTLTAPLPEALQL